jgi:hypothetical protein
MRFYLCLTLLWLASSCTYDTTEFGVASNYFPSSHLLKKGVVNKYHELYEFNDGQAPLIRIRYRKYVQKSSNILHESLYGAGFDLISSRVYRFDSSRQVLLEEKISRNLDTTSSKIVSSGYINWRTSKDTLEFVQYVPNGLYSIQAIQKSNTDDIGDGRKIKVFEHQVLTNLNNGEWSESFKSETTFAEDLGLFTAIAHQSMFTITTELIEQMPLTEFERRSNHGIQRVGYIDPKRILDKEAFSPCGAIDTIRDYYNSDPDGRYIKNKNGLLKDIKTQLDSSLLKNESGFLTFRFVVNCNGEAGWFVSECVDLDYQSKEFDDELRNHLFNILYLLDSWRPVKLREAKQDAYFYITFRMIDGKITDILP